MKKVLGNKRTPAPLIAALSPAGGNENTLFHLDKRSHDQPQHWLLAASALGLQFYSAPAEDADRHGGAGTTLVQDPGLLARGGHPCASHGIAAGLHPELMAKAATATGQTDFPGKCMGPCVGLCLAAFVGICLAAAVLLCLDDGFEYCTAAGVGQSLATHVGHCLAQGRLGRP